MPVVPSPDVALEAAVGPEITRTPPAADPLPPTPEPIVEESALAEPPPDVVAAAEPEPPAAEDDAGEAPEAVAEPSAEPAPEPATEDSAEQTDDAGAATEDVLDEPAAGPAKPWWNPTGGRSDEPDRGFEASDRPAE